MRAYFVEKDPKINGRLFPTLVIKKAPINRSFFNKMAEGKGFEPSIPVTQYNDLANHRLQPLGHPSAREVKLCFKLHYPQGGPLVLLAFGKRALRTRGKIYVFTRFWLLFHRNRDVLPPLTPNVNKSRQFFLKKFVNDLWVGLALAFFKDLSHEETEQLNLTALIRFHL